MEKVQVCFVIENNMLSRKAKALFYQLAGPLMKINGLVYRSFRAQKKGELKVHLGPGQKNYINGWINIDANMFSGKCDIWADLRNPLPFHDDTVDACYSHHMIEHLPDLDYHLRDVYRCLKPGGVYRVGGPSGDSAIAKFIEGDKGWFSDFPDKRSSIGGRFENFVFCRGEHLTILTFSMLEEMMIEIGYRDICSCKPAKETKYPALFNECLLKEHESDFNMPHTLIIEARKPEKA
jgi:predicted SAM-dependent methyltransferase